MPQILNTYITLLGKVSVTPKVVRMCPLPYRDLLASALAFAVRVLSMFRHFRRRLSLVAFPILPLASTSELVPEKWDDVKAMARAINTSCWHVFWLQSYSLTLSVTGLVHHSVPLPVAVWHRLTDPQWNQNTRLVGFISPRQLSTIRENQSHNT